MVVLFVGDERLAEWSENDDKFLEAFQSGKVEFRDNAGKVVARAVPSKEPLWPPDPSYTVEDAKRDARAGDGATLSEIWKDLGAK